ncbi:MAG: apolipoprotein N-acyltransferase, partial [Actinomycetota bacterium]|nr:apolipoprotein N-acyltransferase [Actinomycetota bacterium]
AMELGRSLVNVSTVGTSAIISPTGQTLVQLPTYTPATMVHAVPLSTTITPATYLGEPIEQFVSALGLGGMLVALLMGRAYTRRRSNKKR